MSIELLKVAEYGDPLQPGWQSKAMLLWIYNHSTYLVLREHLIATVDRDKSPKVLVDLVDTLKEIPA